jgi:hypothetical protein
MMKKKINAYQYFDDDDDDDDVFHPVFHPTLWPTTTTTVLLFDKAKIVVFEF